MAFCSNCGASLKQGAKFCDNCGTPVPVVAQETKTTQEASVQPVQGGYTPPVQQAQGEYVPPTQQAQSSYTPPVQQAQGGYTPPAQQAQSSYTPPVQQAQGGYVPPTQQQYGAQAAYAAPQVFPKQKKPLDKKFLLFGGIGIAVILIVVLLVSLLGGKSKPGAASSDPNVGIWTVVTAEMWGMETDISEIFENGFTIELLDKGKCKLNIDGTKGSGKWTLEDGVFTIKGGGLDMSGTLKNGVLVLEDVMGIGLNLKLQKDGAQGGDPSASGADYFVIQSMTQGGETSDKDTLALIGFAEDYVLLYPDGRADLKYFGLPFMASWKEGEITLPGMGVIAYTIAGDELSLEPEAGTRLVYLRSASAPPAALTQTTDVSGGGEEESFVSPTTSFELESYWYGTAIISNFTPKSQAAESEGTYDVWGYIGKGSNGRIFFEIYDVSNLQSEPLLSLYVDLYGDYMQADIGREDAWLFDIYLDEDAEDFFSPMLINGAMQMEYYCTGENIAFGITFFLREDGTPWDEENDLLPPGYDEYKASLGGGEPAPAPTEFLSAAQLREAYDRPAPSGMTYEEVRDEYMHGVDGELTGDDGTIRSYTWKTDAAEYQGINISFKKNDAGKYVYYSMSIRGVPQ